MSRTASPTADSARFLDDVRTGLGQPSRSLPCKYFYDEPGGSLFEKICQLDAYYLPRCELSILQRHGAHLVRALGPVGTVIEYGSGDSAKTRLLLEQVHPAVYAPVDINRPQLQAVAARLAARHPGMSISPVAADFTQPFDLPSLPQGSRLVFFSGSTIGNFPPADARSLLATMRRQAGPGGSVLVGVDLQKDPHLLERAYDDPQGVTAAFNLNLLARINRELGADFVLEQFRHQACYNAVLGRIEMYLVSQCRQTVHVGDAAFAFAAGERICTEYAYKHTLGGFAALAQAAELVVRQVWTDSNGWYSLQLLGSRVDCL
jgi:dimethylhistidine N-methyltransferase